MFFVISGLVIFRAHRKDFNQPRMVGNFYWKRFRRIYPLYWIFLLPTLWRHREATGLPAFYHHHPSVIVSNWLLVHLFAYQPIMMQAWTLFDEIEFYLVFSLCILNLRVGLSVFGVWLAASFLFLAPASPYWLVVLSPYHLLFGVGILAAIALHKGEGIPASLFFWLGLIVFVGAIAAAGQYPSEVIVRLIGGVGAASFLLGAALLERQNRLTIPHWLVFLGDASYSVYLVHVMAVYAVAEFAYAHWRHLGVPSGVWILVFFLVGVVAGVVAHCIVERPLLRVLGKQAIN